MCNATDLKSYIQNSAQMHPSQEKFNFDQCQNCDFVFLNPRVPEKDLHHYYTNFYLPYRGAEAWGKYKNIVLKSQQKQDEKKLKRVKDCLKIDKNALILDIGCGQPTFLKRCYEYYKCEAMGIDFSDNGWANHKDLYRDLKLKVAEIQDLPQNLKPDVITMWHYLEHDYHIAENLKYLKLISHPNTKLIIEIPNFDSMSRKKFGENWAGWHTPRHTSLFSPKNVEMMLNNNDWQIDELLTYGTMDPFVLYWMSKMEQKNIAWNKNLEDEFFDFIKGMVLFLPQRFREKKLSLGVMTIIASPM